MSDVGPALFRAFPALDAQLPFHALARRPAPVARLARLGKRAGADLWVKRDDRLSDRVGGNKVRKLEWLLGAARAAGHERLLTTGVVGSNHVLATAVHGAAAGFEVEAVQFPAPMSGRARRAQAKALSAGLQVRSASSAPAAGWAIARARWQRRKTAYWVAGGGSCAVGTLGYVDAALELAEQVRAGELPEPATIVVACGTGGTVAGLMVGCGLGGLKTRIVGVRVVSSLVCNRGAVAKLANATLNRLRRAGLPRRAAVYASADVSLVHSAFGPGYGQAGRAAKEAVAVARDLEQLPLEPVYTGKAMSALLRMTLEDDGSGGPTLFWHTAPW